MKLNEEKLDAINSYLENKELSEIPVLTGIYYEDIPLDPYPSCMFEYSKIYKDTYLLKAFTNQIDSDSYIMTRISHANIESKDYLDRFFKECEKTYYNEDIKKQMSEKEAEAEECYKDLQAVKEKLDIVNRNISQDSPIVLFEYKPSPYITTNDLIVKWEENNMFYSKEMTFSEKENILNKLNRLNIKDKSKINKFVEYIEEYIPNKEVIMKEKQNELIQKLNPKNEELGNHTWIESEKDIKTFAETLDDLNEDLTQTPDFDNKAVRKALESDIITIYSSHEIKDGAWVTPSKMEAEAYAGTGDIYSKTVNVKEVAWVDTLQGMYANVLDKDELNKTKQFIVLAKNNNSLISKVSQLRTLEELKNEEALYPDFTIEDTKQAIKNGYILMYSHTPIKDNTEITPSYMEARDNAGDSIVYSKIMPLENIAWVSKDTAYAANVLSPEEYPLDTKLACLWNEINEFQQDDSFNDFEIIGLDYNNEDSINILVNCLIDNEIELGIETMNAEDLNKLMSLYEKDDAKGIIETIYNNYSEKENTFER